MAQNVGNIVVDTTVLDKMTVQIRPRAAKIVNTYGLMITSDAVKRAPVDTGALINTLVAASKMIDEMTYRIQDAVTYGIFQELGTSKMAAHPFLVPAMEAWREKFYKAFSELFK